MSTNELVKLFTARARRRFQRGLKRKPMALIKKLRKAAGDMEKLGISEAFKVKQAKMILRVDEIITCAPRKREDRM